VLRALRALLRPGGRIAYTTIYVAPGLSEAQRRRARRSGPPAVASSSQPLQLLRSSNLVDIDSVDLTNEYAETAAAWVAATEANLDALAALDSRAAVEQRLRERDAHLRAIQDGLLKRGLFVASQPITF